MIRNKRNTCSRYNPYKRIKVQINEDDVPDKMDPGHMNISDLTLNTEKMIRNMFGGPDDDTDVYIENNHIYFKTDVDENSINKLCTLIRKYISSTESITSHLYVESVVLKPLYIHITSYGGSLYQSLIAYDYIKNSPIAIHTIIEGYAASGGTIISVAGKKRYITQNSVMLIHQLSTRMSGKYEELVDDMDNSKQDMKRIIDIYLSECKGKMTRKQIQEYLKHDKWWNANDAIKKGLCDEIYNKIF